MTEAQREILRHALGLNRGRRAYRNRFVTGPGSDDYDNCRALVAAGLMQEHRSSLITGGDAWFSVTDAGRAALGL